MKHLQRINEFNDNLFLDTLSRQDYKDIIDIVDEWMSDTENFDRSRMNFIYDKFKNSKYISNGDDVYRVLFFKDLEQYLNEDGSINITKLHSNIKIDSNYYSYTKSLGDLIYVIWRWTDNPPYWKRKGSDYGIVIKHKSKDAINLTEFNVDAYRYLSNKYSFSDPLVFDYRSADMQEDEGESEVVSRMTPFEIVGVIEYDPDELYDHIGTEQITENTWDDYEEDAGLYYYPIDSFKMNR